MTKNRNKKKRERDDAAMDVTADDSKQDQQPQAMDTSETAAQNNALGVHNKKIKKGIPMKRAKKIRKTKAIEKAISKCEKREQKILKHGDKVLRTQSAKTLYE